MIQWIIFPKNESGVPVADLCREHGISNATYYIYGQLSRCKVLRSDRSRYLGANIYRCQSAPNVDPLLECAPAGGH